MRNQKIEGFTGTAYYGVSGKDDIETIRGQFPGRMELEFLKSGVRGLDEKVFIPSAPVPVSMDDGGDGWISSLDRKLSENGFFRNSGAYSWADRQVRRKVRVRKIAVSRTDEDGETSPLFHNRFLKAVRDIGTAGLAGLITVRAGRDSSGNRTVSYMFFPAVR